MAGNHTPIASVFSAVIARTLRKQPSLDFHATEFS